MEKPLHFFNPDTEQNEYLALWSHLPQEGRQARERICARIRVKYLSLSFEQEEDEHDASDESWE